MRITGQTISLRDFRLDDIERLALWYEPGHRWQQLDGPYYPLPSEEKQASRAAELRRQIEQGFPTPRKDMVIADLETDDLIGRVVWSWQSQETLWLSVGIDLYDETTWGRGLGYQALGLWSDYLMTSMPEIVRLDLRTWSGNTGMMRLAEKLGYREEARFRKARFVDGEYFDAMGYGVLREEWETLYPSGFTSRLHAHAQLV